MVYTEVMALNVGVICGLVAAAGLGALVVQAALITGAMSRRRIHRALVHGNDVLEMPWGNASCVNHDWLVVWLTSILFSH